jgi:hypothetical protein
MGSLGCAQDNIGLIARVGVTERGQLCGQSRILTSTANASQTPCPAAAENDPCETSCSKSFLLLMLLGRIHAINS